MQLYFTSMVDTARWGARMYTLAMSDNYISLWKKAGIYDLLYEREGVTCEDALPDLIWALTDMCTHYIDFRTVVKLAPVNEGLGSFMDELLREQSLRQAIALLAMLIQTVSLYPRAIICRRKEEATVNG